MRTDYITHEALEHVKAALTPENRLVIEVMEQTGLRVDDVLELQTQLLAPRMYVREKKTGKSRRIYLGNDLVARLKKQAGKIYVFEGRDDPKKHRTRQAVWKDIKRACKAFRFKGNFSSHSVRKTYAVDLMRRYKDIRKVQKVLGHDRPETTMIYALADLLTRSV